MAEKLFNEYYTKNFELPGRFTAMNGAIQYFTLKANGVEFEVAPLAEDASDEEKAIYPFKVQAARANYLRVLEVLRSRGPQPIITSVEGDTLHFTVEQSWAYGKRKPIQVSEHFEPSFDPKEDAYTGLAKQAEDDIEEAFAGIKSFKAKEIKEDVYEVVEEDDFDVKATVKVSAGSLVADK